ncbi:tRNA pseudouridine(65) synthase TruC [Oceanisphaera profunda]|uniref:tRNA pseudouridine synthase C n=1 Tax=Oceanisphaera profunda TaxID=1416627 RepID=A0A1Y0D8P0_9GAMM|nr:tRNA pseudouridine(65) synthase TruC [Oceanisphaera profunda]ART83486.1 tRNA pseudouridine(65) synthase TruC [Oceanisphaera profunda]
MNSAIINAKSCEQHPDATLSSEPDPRINSNRIDNGIDIIFEDDSIVAINKEAGLLVHRSWLDKGETRFAMQLTRDAVGCHVFPVHRLDRPTSGVLLFAKSSTVARSLTEAFTEHKVVKQYLAVVRGFMPQQGTLDYALSFQPDAIADKFADVDKPPQEAVTHWQSLAQIELPFAVSKKHDTSRYSLVRLMPETGRKHQLRRHMAHLFHPIVGDTSHGDGRHNRFFRSQYACERMLLHAQSLALTHPVTGMPLLLEASLDQQWQRIMKAFNW